MTTRYSFRNRARRDRRKALLIADPTGDALRASAVAHWKMDETSGTRVDATGNGHNLSAVGTVLSAAGKVGDAIATSVADANGLFRASDVSFRSLGLQTISFWGWAKIDDFDPPATDHTVLYVTAKGNFNGVSIDYFLAYNSVAGLYFDVYDADDNEIGFVQTSAPITEGVWFFFVCEIDVENEKVIFRVNTIEEESPFASTPVAYTQATPNYGISVGAEVNFLFATVAEYQINGNVDGVGFIGRILTTNEKNYLYNSGAGRTLYP